MNELISRHTTQWFHRVNRDELSPAISLHEILTQVLGFIEARKLSITIAESTFRKNMCEFLCMYYVSQKQQVSWRGPLSAKPRPRGWTDKHEQQWENYLRFAHFSSEYWNTLWDNTPEALWESRVNGWRNHFEYIVMHYIVVQPSKIDMPIDRNSNAPQATNAYDAYDGYDDECVGSVGGGGSDEERY
jgi:hypothetical protein